jgi:flagellin-like protein
LKPQKGGIKTKMKKLWKGKKALSPVVAAIILIAVTVAVSIAVAAWMGALTFTFMATEQLEIQGAEFLAGNTVNMTAQNTGTSDLTVSKYKTSVSGNPTALSASVDIAQGASAEVTVPLTWVSGTTYDIYLVTSAGKQFPYRATAP